MPTEFARRAAEAIVAELNEASRQWRGRREISIATIIDRLAVDPVLATKLTPEAVADILTQDQVGGLVYKGNSVSFLYDKMLAYKASMGRACDRARIAGREDMKPEIADARHAGAEEMRERAAQLIATTRTGSVALAMLIRALPLDPEEQT